MKNGFHKVYKVVFPMFRPPDARIQHCDRKFGFYVKNKHQNRLEGSRILNLGSNITNMGLKIRSENLKGLTLNT